MRLALARIPDEAKNIEGRLDWALQVTCGQIVDSTLTQELNTDKIPVTLDHRRGVL